MKLKGFNNTSGITDAKTTTSGDAEILEAVSVDNGFEGDPDIVEHQEEREAEALKRREERLEKYEKKRAKLAEREAEKEFGGKGGNGGNGGSGGKGGVGGFVAAIVALSMACIVLATVLLSNIFVRPENEGDRYIRAAYYNFSDYVGEMDDDLNKLIVTNDKTSQQKYLLKLSVASSLAAENISALPLKDESKFNTTKFVNQVGDYSKYLNNQLIDGFSLTEEDKEKLKSIREINGALKKELSDLNKNMGDDFDFSSLLRDGEPNAVLERFDKLEENAVEYPKLIYDGPFSDALEEERPKALDGDEITLTEAKDIFNNIFGKEGLENVTEEGEREGVIATYNFTGRINSDVEVYASISKVGGKLVQFNYFADCAEDNHSLDECVEIGKSFLNSMGFEDLEPVWSTEKGATAYINYAFIEDGVIVYNDMIKLTVCKERGLVSNFDAREYYLNHEERDIPEAMISENEAKTDLLPDFSIETVKKAYIPYGEKREILVYEFMGTVDGATYYIYIDALTGRQAQIFRVVETDEGTLLI